MAIAVNEVARLHGGLTVVCDGNVMDSMCLPIGGLMSECGAAEVMRLLDGMNEAARQPFPRPEVSPFGTKELF